MELIRLQSLPFVTPSVRLLFARQFTQVLANSTPKTFCFFFAHVFVFLSSLRVRSWIVFCFYHWFAPSTWLVQQFARPNPKMKWVKRARAGSSTWIIVSDKLISNSFSGASADVFVLACRHICVRMFCASSADHRALETSIQILNIKFATRSALRMPAERCIVDF